MNTKRCKRRESSSLQSVWCARIHDEKGNPGSNAKMAHNVVNEGRVDAFGVLRRDRGFASRRRSGQRPFWQIANIAGLGSQLISCGQEDCIVFTIRWRRSM
jgi:hypothetical protein